MSVSHIFGTAVFLLNAAIILGQPPNGQGMFAQRNQFPSAQNQFPPAQRGFNMPNNFFNGQGNRQPTGQQFGFNVPPPAGFQPLTRQMQNQFQLQNALPRNPNAAPNAAVAAAAAARAASAAGVLSVLNTGGLGFTNRFGAASGQELARQLTASPDTGGSFNEQNAPQQPQGFPGFNGIQGQPPNFAFQRPPMMRFGQAGMGQRPGQGQQIQGQRPMQGQQIPGQRPMQGQQIPGQMSMQGQQIPGQNFMQGQQVPGQRPAQGQQRPGQQVRGPRNQPQGVMPRMFGAVDFSNLRPGQVLGNEPNANMGMPTNARGQPQNPFGVPNNFAQRPPTQQRPPAFGTPQQNAQPQQPFGGQRPFGIPQNFNSPQPFVPPQNVPRSVPNQNPPAPRSAPPTNQGFGRGISLAFPTQPLTQSIGVGRPSSQVSVPAGAPPLRPGEVEIAPPISPADAAQMQGTSENPPQAVSEIITISDINGNVLYRGVDLSDSEIEKITQQLVSNMSDSQAAEAAAKGRELESQGKLDTAGTPQQFPSGQSQTAAAAAQPSPQQPAQPSGQGFSTWGQQGLRFPGQPVAGESRTVVNFLDSTK